MSGTSIIYALLIAMLIYVADAAMVTVAGFHRYRSSRIDVKEKLMDNAVSAMRMALHSQSVEDDETLDLFESQSDSVRITTIPWGVYDVHTSVAFQREDSFKIEAMSGSSWKADKTVLFIADRNEPISLSGNAHLKGLCHLPKRGARRGHIGAQNFTREKLVDGLTKKSSKYLPQWNKDRCEIAYNQEGNTSEIFLDSLNVPFKNEKPVEVDLTGLDLWSISLTGFIVARSNHHVHIPKTAKLENIILIAPSITIESGFKGSLQAFCTDSVFIEEEVDLEYPSVLCLQDNGLDKPPWIRIGDQSTIKGGVITYQKNRRIHDSPLVFTDKNSRIEGLVWVQGELDCRGLIVGSTYCEYVTAHTAGGKYLNHILHGKFIGPESSLIAFPKLMPATSKKNRIIKWLS